MYWLVDGNVNGALQESNPAFPHAFTAALQNTATRVTGTNCSLMNVLEYKHMIGSIGGDMKEKLEYLFKQSPKVMWKKKNEC